MVKKFALILMAVCSAAFAVKSTFKVEAANVPNGTIQFFGNGFASDSTVYAGEQVGVHYAPVTGYVLDQVRAFQTGDTTKEVSLQEDSTNYFSFIMPSADVTLSGSFKKGSFNVAVNGCSQLTCPAASVHEFGSQVSVTITKPSTLNGEFTLSLVGIDTSAITSSRNGDDYVYTFSMPGHDVTFTVKENLSVKPTRYKITLNGCDGLNCSAPDSADVDDEVTISILNTDSVRTTGVEIAGFDNGDVVRKVDNADSTVYVIKMPSNDVTLSISSETMTYLVSVQNAQNGSVSYTGNSYVKYGSNVSFTVTPDANYEIDFVKVVNAGKQSESVTPTKKNNVYTYKVPGFNTIIAAAFKAVAGSSSSGTDPQSSESSSSKKVESSSSSSDSQNSSFSEDNGYYCVDIVPDENGTIQMAGSFAKQQKNCTLEGNEITLGVYPESGYILESISVKMKNGEKISLKEDSSTYKFKMPASDVTVKATYKVGEYDVKVEGCGELKCEVSQAKAKAGDDIKVTITLVAGYSGFTLSAIGLKSVDRKDSGAKTTLSFTMPGNDVTIMLEPQGKSSPETSSSSSKEGGDSKSSSSGKSGKSSSSKSGKSSSSKGKDAIQVSAQMPLFSVVAADRQILVSGVPAGADYFLLDINGRVMSQGCSVAQDFAIAVPRAGYYLLRVGNTVRTVNVQ